MKLTLQGLQEKEQWKNAGIGLPSYDIEKVAAFDRKSAPQLLSFHFVHQSKNSQLLILVHLSLLFL